MKSEPRDEIWRSLTSRADREARAAGRVGDDCGGREERQLGGVGAFVAMIYRSTDLSSQIVHHLLARMRFGDCVNSRLISYLLATYLPTSTLLCEQGRGFLPLRIQRFHVRSTVLRVDAFPTSYGFSPFVGSFLFLCVVRATKPFSSGFRREPSRAHTLREAYRFVVLGNP